MEIANWWNVYSKIWVKSNVLNYPGVCLEIRAFWHTYLGSKYAPVITPSSPDKAFPLSQSKVLRTKERDDDIRQVSSSLPFVHLFPLFDCRLQNITDLVFRGLYCPSSQNLIKRLCIKSLQKVKDSLNHFPPINGSLTTPQPHIITSPDT